ncbi:MAG: NAD(P)H-hydrate dehydratase [Lactobacillus sp.]|jgi:hydroxyethylthiazole kinase-like uncharacterized protein yjeF|nr:NAD(P)H-hydrate dehydratase [Lactobacillus sp.]
MAQLFDETLAKQVIKQRSEKSHKGNYGRILLIGGSLQFGGAIIMAAQGAVEAGAGLVSVATHSVNLTSLHARVPEAMFIDWRDPQLLKMIRLVDVVAIGPGLGTDRFAQALLNQVVVSCTSKQTVVLDASALDLLGKNKNFWPQAAGLVVLTPHQMEWQRVSGLQIDFQTDAANQAALNELAVGQPAVLVLKSHQTHIYSGQETWLNTTGNPGMATGGTGDTLTGIIAAFLGQFGSSLTSVLAAVYTHSYAGDQVFRDNYVVRPTALAEQVPLVMKKFSGQ